MSEFSNAFGTAKMQRLLTVSFAPVTFIHSTLFRETNKTNNQFIVVDKEVRGRYLAAFASPLHKGVPVEKKGYFTDVFKPAYIKESKLSNAYDLLQNRQAGEDPYKPVKSARALAMAEMGKDITILDERYRRRLEYMCCQTILTGKVKAQGRGIDLQYDFQLPAENIWYVGSDPGISKSWTDISADILTDIENAGEVVKKNTGKIPNLVVLGRNIWKYVRKNDQILELLDNRRVDGNVINLDLLPKSVKVLGEIGGYNFVQYVEHYQDEDDNFHEMFDPDSVLITSTDLRASMEYGAIVDLDYASNQPAEKFVKSWREMDPSGQIVLLQSSPICVHHEMNGVMVLNPTKPAP